MADKTGRAGANPVPSKMTDVVCARVAVVRMDSREPQCVAINSTNSSGSHAHYLWMTKAQAIQLAEDLLRISKTDLTLEKKYGRCVPSRHR